jgi:type I restriction enzyme M protein
MPYSCRTGSLVEHFQEKVAFLWSIADLLRGDYKPSDYAKVILPFTVLRRLDGVPNSSGLELGKLGGNAAQLARYIKGFPADLRDIFQCFRFGQEIVRLRDAGLLEHLVRRFSEVDLSPRSVSNQEMGHIFEELLRKFSEQSGEAAGEHFTPRDVIRLMLRLLFDGGQDVPSSRTVAKTLYDPACGTGGMLSVAEEYLRETHPGVRLEICGQELNPESYAICKADTILRGHGAGSIALGNSLLHDAFAGRRFDYMLSNPPFGVEWKKAEKHIRAEHERLGSKGRFGAGLPRVNDGSLLFLQHMLSKMKPEGSRIAVVFNGSPLFSGEAGSGESNIRRWIVENDWLEAIVALPDQLFYNTGLATYLWLLTNHKSPERQGRVQLIDASSFSAKMPRSLGARRNQISPAQIDEVSSLHRVFRESRHSKILRNQELSYQRIIVERPLRLNFQASPERISSADHRFDLRVVSVLKSMNGSALYRDQAEFDRALEAAFRGAGMKLGRTLRRRIAEALASQDDSAAICRDSRGRSRPDPDLRDAENVPLDQDLNAWFEREVLPHAPDAWIGQEKPRIGCAIPFARYFFEPQPLRSLSEIDLEIRELESQTQSLLDELGTA